MAPSSHVYGNHGQRPGCWAERLMEGSIFDILFWAVSCALSAGSGTMLVTIVPQQETLRESSGETANPSH